MISISRIIRGFSRIIPKVGYHSRIILIMGFFLGLAFTIGAEIPNPLRVALVPNLFPFSFLNEDEEPDGVYPLIISEIAKNNQIKIEWVEGSWGESLRRARDGEIDLMTTLIYTAERDEYLDYSSVSVIYSWSQVFQGKEGMAATILDLEDKRIGMVSGDQNGQGFVKLAGSFNIRYQVVYFDTFVEVSQALGNGDIDAGVFYSLYQLSDPELIPTSIIYQPNNSYFAVPENADREILRLIDESLTEWKEDQDSFYYRQVMALLSQPKSEIPRWLFVLFIVFCGLAITAGIFIWVLRRQVRIRTSQLVEAQNVYRLTFMESNVGFAITGINGAYLKVNPRFCEYLGYSEKDLLGKKFAEFTLEDDLGDQMSLFDEIVRGERSSYRINKRYRTKDGSIVWADLSVSCIRDESGRILYFVGLTEDITERMLAETRLGDLESRYRGMFQNSYQMTALLDNMGRLVDANETLLKAFGLRGDLHEMIGQTMADMEWLGSFISLQLQEIVDECLSTGQTIRHTLGLNETRTGRALDVTIKPVVDDDGNIRYCIIEVHDVTELIELTSNLEKQVEERTREIREAQEHLIEAEKMASLGRLVAGVAHEINTPIGVSRTGVSYLMEQMRDIRRGFDEKTLTEEDFYMALDSIDDLSEILDQNLERAVKLIQDFKLTSVDQANQGILMVNVYDYLSSIMHTISPKLKKSGVVWNIDAPREELFLYVGAINLIIINLTLNAISHAFDSEGGRIDLTYRAINGTRILTFADNGKGIDEDNLKRIFEPFYTTERSRGFTGLGLNIVYNLVKDMMHGTVTCENKSGGGTMFRIEYPEPECPATGG